MRVCIQKHERRAEIIAAPIVAIGMRGVDVTNALSNRRGVDIPCHPHSEVEDSHA